MRLVDANRQSLRLCQNSDEPDDVPGPPDSFLGTWSGRITSDAIGAGTASRRHRLPVRLGAFCSVGRDVEGLVSRFDVQRGWNVIGRIRSLGSDPRAVLYARGSSLPGGDGRSCSEGHGRVPHSCRQTHARQLHRGWLPWRNAGSTKASAHSLRDCRGRMWCSWRADQTESDSVGSTRAPRVSSVITRRLVSLLAPCQEPRRAPCRRYSRQGLSC